MANMTVNFSKQKQEGKKLPDRDPNEHYATPLKVAETCSEILLRYWYEVYQKNMGMLDIGADTGVWGDAVSDLWQKFDDMPPWIGGIELRDVKKPDHYKEWFIGDATEMSNIPDHYDIAFGNPPYLAEGNGRKMTKMLSDFKQRFTVMGFLLRTDFLASQMRYDALFTQGLAVVANSISRVHFVGRGTQQYREYSFYIWDKHLPEDRLPVVTWFDHNKGYIETRFKKLYGGE